MPNYFHIQNYALVYACVYHPDLSFSEHLRQRKNNKRMFKTSFFSRAFFLLQQQTTCCVLQRNYSVLGVVGTYC